jgi:hypothetical protein
MASYQKHVKYPTIQESVSVTAASQRHPNVAKIIAKED